jgi:hypothetical protein
MDVSTREQWMEIVDRTTEAQPRVARRLLDTVKGLRHITDGFSLDQMQPTLQRATRAEPWYELAERFADLWDQKAFDASYETESLEHFEPTLNNVLAQAHSI